ncbi:hypothetical protein SDC9_136630 [bioreactor metagenome]|uniref:Uncharacterized protein n=1 Tax=bioreactor metagenome TaxID=1076179 RepID=A0A645DJU1_9ZZZZ
MTTVQKLKYDLAMNCAFIEVMQQVDAGTSENIRSEMFEAFLSNYTGYCMMDQTQFKEFSKKISDLEKLSPNLLNPRFSF